MIFLAFFGLNMKAKKEDHLELKMKIERMLEILKLEEIKLRDRCAVVRFDELLPVLEDTAELPEQHFEPLEMDTDIFFNCPDNILDLM